jgi:hypothetical protein
MRAHGLVLHLLFHVNVETGFDAALVDMTVLADQRNLVSKLIKKNFFITNVFFKKILKIKIVTWTERAQLVPMASSALQWNRSRPP